MDALVFKDTTGQPELLNVNEMRSCKALDNEDMCYASESEDSESSKDEVKNNNLPLFTIPKATVKVKKVFKRNKHEEDIDMDDVYTDVGRSRGKILPMNYDVRKISNLDEVMKKSVISPGFEKLHTVPPYEVSQQALRKERKKEREKTKGSKWFNMPATELTDELKKDLEVIQMRSVLDPKHFYKKNTLEVLPKYFQVGRIVESPADFYHSRIPQKERKKTIVEELLADSQFKKYNKKRYTEIIEERRKTSFKAHKHAKRLKNKKR